MLISNARLVSIYVQGQSSDVDCRDWIDTLGSACMLNLMRCRIDADLKMKIRVADLEYSAIRLNQAVLHLPQPATRNMEHRALRFGSKV